MGSPVTKCNAAMFLAVVMMIASAMKMVKAHESESIELTIRSSDSFKEDGKLHACCPSMTTWNCYRVCRLKGNQKTCSNLCSCKLVEILTNECVRLNQEPGDESAQIMTRIFLKEIVSQKLRACCENAQRWNCYRVCRLGVGSQQQCANLCSCVLLTELTPNCYRGVNEIPKLQHGIDGEPKLSTQMFLKEQVSQTLMPCCENAESLACYRICRMVPWACAKKCSCVLVTELTPNCYQGVNEIPEIQHGIDGEPQLSTEMFFKEQVSQKLSACCENAQRWNCYRVCRLTGSQQVCANLCSCVLVTQLTPNCYRGVNEIPELQHGIDGEPKIRAQD